MLWSARVLEGKVRLVTTLDRCIDVEYPVLRGVLSEGANRSVITVHLATKEDLKQKSAEPSSTDASERNALGK